MILIGIGGNLPGPFGPPQTGLPHALKLLEEQAVKVALCSPWYGARAVPVSEQPDFINAVACLETDLSPQALLALLHQVERLFGRVRGVVNAARTLDLDLLAYGDICQESDPELPHPRMHLRAFVLSPLCDIAPDWRHPVLKRTARELLQTVPAPHGVWRL
jgi:2-amino-4-hydroxy-6-hydroxymethyldihydropteridine diphosphokinase